MMLKVTFGRTVTCHRCTKFGLHDLTVNEFKSNLLLSFLRTSDPPKSISLIIVLCQVDALSLLVIVIYLRNIETCHGCTK